MCWKQRAAVGALVAVGLTGCSYSAEKPAPPAVTCDVSPSPANPEAALRTLLEAASLADATLACTVTTGTPEGLDLGAELAQLQGEVQERGITVENGRMEKLSGDWAASLYSVTGPSETGLEPLEFEFVRQKGGGYRVAFPLPDELYL